MKKTNKKHIPVLKSKTIKNNKSKKQSKQLILGLGPKMINSIIIALNEDDKIKTLSSCSYEFDDARIVVHGKLIN